MKAIYTNYKVLIIITYLIFLFTSLLMDDFITFVPDFIIAIFGIATILSALFSPILLAISIYNFKVSGFSFSNIFFSFLSILYFAWIIFIIYKIFPQLMGI